MVKLHFPHISRLFSAKPSIPLAITLCWSILTACIIINIRVTSAYDTATRGVVDTLEKTDDVTLTRSLSDRFEKSGIPSVARELRRSNDSRTAERAVAPETNGVLGSQTQTLSYLIKILEEHPDYRDAYLAAAKSALLEHNMKEALVLTKQVLEIDPNDKTALVLMTILEKTFTRN
jgi:Flp pilus assembly protein TadD